MRNFIRAYNGSELTADEIVRSGCRIILVCEPAQGSAVSRSIIWLPPAARMAPEGLIVVKNHLAFGYAIMSDHGEMIGGLSEFTSPGGIRLLPLLAGDGGPDGWGVIG
jgi:hypothetical protein